MFFKTLTNQFNKEPFSEQRRLSGGFGNNNGVKSPMESDRTSALTPIDGF